MASTKLDLKPSLQPEAPKTVPLGRFELESRLFQGLTFISAMFVLAVLSGILIALFVKAWPAFSKFALSFFTSSNWDIVNDQYGALAPIVGTLTTSLLALLIAVPLAFGTAIFITELSPEWFKRPVGTAIELLAAVPSVIFG